MAPMPNSLVATIYHSALLPLLTRDEEFEEWLHASPNDPASKVLRQQLASGQYMVE